MELTQIGKYTIVAKIGEGAMGEIFKAHDPDLNRFVAIKTISRNLDADERSRERFQREARSAANLLHPNIVTIFAFGEEQGTAYIVMELLEGTDLKEKIAKRAIVRLEDKLSVLEQICDGLAFAHAKGVVHRDLKPGNIHVLPNSQVKIMDFGLARGAAETTRTSVVMGTPHYMSPEQARGERATIRSDIFSVGALAYELIAYRRPFGGESIPAVLFNVVHHEPEPVVKWIPELPALATVVDKALTKDPDRRFHDAREMREALRAVRQSLSGPAPVVDPAGATLAGVAPPTPSARALPRALSEAPEADPEVREALGELQEYLADRLPPLMIAESMTVLMRCTPDGVAGEIYTWALQQGRTKPSVPISDFLFHALRKLHLMGEFKLVDKRSLDGFLGDVGEALVEFCPPADRDSLKQSLASLGRSEMVRTSTVEILHRQHGAERVLPDTSPYTRAKTGAGTDPVPEEALQGQRRLSLLVERLEHEAQAPAEAPGADETHRHLLSQTLATAAASSTTEQELEEHLSRLQQLGIAAGAEQIFRSLGQALPDWVLPPGADTASLVESGEMEAMRRIIALAEEPVEMAKRYRGLVYAAIEQFNQGNLGRTVNMLDLALRLIEEKVIEGDFVEVIRRKGHESLDMDRVRKLAESPDKHPQLRKVLTFFSFGLGYLTLLGDLQVEQRRDRRRLILALLEAHGAPARAAALQRIEGFVESGDDPGPHMLRNMVYLLRLIPRPDDEPAEREIELVGRLGEPGRPAFLVREVVSYLGQARHPKAKQALVGLLHAHEADLTRPQRTPEQLKDGQGVLDKICAVLARLGNPAAWSVVVEHGLSARPELGATINRLTELASQDLSASPPLVERLLGELQSALPRGVLKFLVPKKDLELVCLIEALSGTNIPEVQQVLEDVARRFPNQSFGSAAAKALEALLARGQGAAGPEVAASESGELEMFGLPSLLHALGEKRATGRLGLLDHTGGPVATMQLEGGRLRACQISRLQGEEAFFQLLERPFPGRYSFEAGPSEAGPGPVLDVPSLTGEGIRRYGSLQRSSALVPDDVALEPSGTSPTAVPDEQDYALVVTLWERACAGTTPRECEAELTVDAFRVRRALAHWMEEGALRRRSAQ